MKNLKRLSALLLIICLMLPALAAAEVTYPYTSDKPVELTYWTPIANNAISYISSYNENEAIQEINKNTGINVTFEHPAIGQEKQSIALMIAGEEMADIIVPTSATPP